ncbi:hypothetical protein WMY93_011441 [Mugilogobius chulae]|uniref:Transglutaminase C-terminal domain-containing protein n=1 Tax=Mugilogobius chulae TaxID=88201 RepID=A0AAW0P2R7_9GOBI
MPRHLRSIRCALVSRPHLGSHTPCDVGGGRGTEEERQVFKYAITRDYTKNDEESKESEEENEHSATGQGDDGDPTHQQDRASLVVNGDAVGGSANGSAVPETTGGSDTVVNGTSSIIETALPQVTLKFEEVSKPVNGKDVKVNLVLQSEALVPRKLSINIRVTAMSYNNTPLSVIKFELKEETLLPGKDLSVPVEVSFSEYWQPMLDSDVMQVSTVVSDPSTPDHPYLAQSDLVLQDPPLDIKLLNQARMGREAIVEVSFLNPVNETLKECTLSLSGSGLLKEEQHISLPDMEPSNRVRVQVGFYPYKTGVQTLVADFDCSMFRDIKNNLSVPVKDNIYIIYRY